MSKDTISKAEFDAFRAKTVEVALKAAKDHGLCAVVQRTLCKAGFSDLLPPLYSLEVKPEADYGWSSTYHSDFTSLDKAISAAKGYRRNAIAEARNSAAYEVRRTSSMWVHLDNGTPDELAESVKTRAKAYQQSDAQARRSVDTTWPKVRVVERTWQPNGRTSKKAVETVE